MKTLRRKIIARAATACGITLALSGCMNGLENGPQLATQGSTLRPSGFTLNPSEQVNVHALNWCTGATTSVFSARSSATKTVFPGAGSGGADAAGFAWGTSGMAQGPSCNLWTPYGCSSPDWGANQGALRLKPIFTRADGTTYDGAVFTDPASGEAHLFDCAKRKLEANPSLTPTAAAMACGDPDGFADIQTRGTSATWAFDFDWVQVRGQQEGGDDEVFNPAIIGIRTQLTPNATVQTGWINSLSYRSLRKDAFYHLDDRNGRVQMRNVQSISFGEFLGCDPVTSRVVDTEVATLLSLVKKNGSNLTAWPLADLARGGKIINEFRCDRTQTPKDITVVGVAMQALEADFTPTSWTVDSINKKIGEDKAVKQPYVRDIGNQLVSLRNKITAVIDRCNATLKPDGSKSEACTNELVSLKDLSLNLPPAPVATETMNALDEIIAAFSALVDADDKIGLGVTNLYVAITPGFYKLLQTMTGRSKPGEIALLEVNSTLKRTAITPIFMNQSGAAYWLTGNLRNFTADLKEPTRLANDRAANAGRCPWNAPPETVNTGVNL